MDLGHRVRDLRNAQHLSQIELAARAGVARNTLNRIENGHLMPTAPVIEHLAEALNVTPGALFEEPVVPLGEPAQGTRGWNREAHGLAPYATSEERRAVLNEVGRDVQYAIGRAEYWEQELERGRMTQYSRASSAENLAILAVQEFSEISRWLGEDVAPGLDAQIERGLASEIADEYVSLMDTFVYRVVQTQHMLFDNAARVAETQDQKDGVAKQRERADRSVQSRSRSTKSA
jgi:transcriptional regulator with XRE-family HTH domain